MSESTISRRPLREKSEDCRTRSFCDLSKRLSMAGELGEEVAKMGLQIGRQGGASRARCAVGSRPRDGGSLHAWLWRHTTRTSRVAEPERQAALSKACGGESAARWYASRSMRIRGSLGDRRRQRRGPSSAPWSASLESSSVPSGCSGNVTGAFASAVPREQHSNGVLFVLARLAEWWRGFRRSRRVAGQVNSSTGHLGDAGL